MENTVLWNGAIAKSFLSCMDMKRHLRLVTVDADIWELIEGFNRTMAHSSVDMSHYLCMAKDVLNGYEKLERAFF